MYPYRLKSVPTEEPHLKKGLSICWVDGAMEVRGFLEVRGLGA